MSAHVWAFLSHVVARPEVVTSSAHRRCARAAYTSAISSWHTLPEARRRHRWHYAEHDVCAHYSGGVVTRRVSLLVIHIHIRTYDHMSSMHACVAQGCMCRRNRYREEVERGYAHKVCLFCTFIARASLLAR